MRNHQEMDIEERKIRGRKHFVIPIPERYINWLRSLELELTDVEVCFQYDLNAPIVVEPKSRDYTGDLAKWPEHLAKMEKLDCENISLM